MIHLPVRQAAINVAEGKKQSVILESEASKEREINQALGNAQAIELRARATAVSVQHIAAAIKENGTLYINLINALQ